MAGAARHSQTRRRRNANSPQPPTGTTLSLASMFQCLRSPSLLNVAVSAVLLAIVEHSIVRATSCCTHSVSSNNLPSNMVSAFSAAHRSLSASRLDNRRPAAAYVPSFSPRRRRRRGDMSVVDIVVEGSSPYFASLFTSLSTATTTTTMFSRSKNAANVRADENTTKAATTSKKLKDNNGVDDSNDDAKDLRDASDASALLRSVASALNFFAPNDGDKEGIVKEGEKKGENSVEEYSSSSSSSPWTLFVTPWSILDPSSDEAKRLSLQLDVRSKYRDLTNDGFGPLLPVAEKVDELTGGWGLSYADLSPETPRTPLGVAFLATNAFYALAGLVLCARGDVLLGSLTEVAGVVSFWYHYSQLQFGQDRSEVRLALLTDYMTAGSAIITGGLYMVNLGLSSIPLDIVLFGGLSIACLTCSWIWEFGYGYLFWHSLWHIFSAYAGYLIGQAHLRAEFGGAGAGAGAAVKDLFLSGGEGISSVWMAASETSCNADVTTAAATIATTIMEDLSSTFATTVSFFAPSGCDQLPSDWISLNF